MITSLHRYISASVCSALIFFCTLCSSFAQNLNPTELYHAAMKEMDLDKRIEKLNEVVRLDDNHVEAYYEIGKCYKKKEKWESAKRSLLKAYTVQLARINNNTKSIILYELASVYKYLGQIEACEDALRGAGNLTTDTSLRERINIELSEVLYQQNRFEEASLLLSQYSNSAYESNTYLKKLLDANGKALELDKIYHQAVDAETNGNIDKAKGLYVSIENQMPGFKNVQERLREINKTLQNTPAATITTTQSISVEQKIKTDHPDTQNSQTDTKDNAYLAAQSIDNNYNQNYNIPKSIINNDVAISATDHTSSLNIKSDEIPESAPNHTAELYPPFINKTQDLKKNYITQPQFKSSNLHQGQVITKITGTINQKIYEKPVGVTSKVFFIIKITGSIIFFSLFSTFFYSPTFKARCYYLLGKHELSIKVYEKLLARRPDMLWVYPKLARLYDLNNRQDTKALRVYKMIQHLNFHSTMADSFNANISNKYLSEIKTETVQIEIIDSNKIKKR